MASTFPPSDLCFTLPDAATMDDICFPGGFCLSYIWDGLGKIQHAADIPLDFFAQIGPAMAPLTPLFNVLDTVIAVYRCVKAIPDAITSLDPSELLDCLPALAALVDQLLKLVPMMSVPKLVKQALLTLAMLLRGIASDFVYTQTLLERIANAIDRAAQLDDVRMNGFLVCAQDDVNKTVSATSQALKGIGRIILLINIFMGLIGGPEIPCFGSLLDDNIDQGFDYVIDLFNSLAEILEEIARAIPDPDLILTVALAGQEC
jgi:hypothetical protein